MKNPAIIYQSRTGINLKDGYYLAKNPRTHTVCVISITQGLVCIHEITKQMNLHNLVQLDSNGFLDIYEELEQKIAKQKYKLKKEPKE